MERPALASRLLDVHAAPLVRRLLLLHELRRQNNGPANNPADEASSRPQHEMGAELERLRQERQLLTLLRGALHNAEEALTVGGENGNGEAHGDGQSDERQIEAARKIGRQLAGAAVPLLAILQRRHHQGAQQQQTSSNEDCGRTHLIRRSAEYACTEEAARALQDIWRVRWRAVAGLQIIDTGAEENGAGVDGAAIDDGIKTLALPALLSCAVALSSLDITEEGGKDSSSALGGAKYAASEAADAEKKSADEASSSREPALDRGEECAAAILACVRSFVSPGEDAHRSSDEQWPSLPETGKGNVDAPASPLAAAVASAMGGALVARLVQGCLSLLPGGDTQTQNNGKGVHRTENAALQLEAVSTLHSLLIGVPLRELWGSMLPGCFAGLYRAAVATLRYASMAAESKVGAGCVECVALLLTQSLSCGPSEEDRGLSSANANDEVQSVADSLMAAVRMSEQPARVDEASVPGEASPEDKRRMDMKMEVNQRLPGPLSVLLSLLTANRSIAVRTSGVHLCRAILVDAHSVWSGSNATALSKKALEYCLATLCDDDKGLSRCSRDTLRLYKAHLGLSGWKQLLGQSVAPAVLELVEALPAFARSGRESEVCNHLRLIDGYLLVSFRGTDDDFNVQECLEERRKSDIGSALGCTEAVEVLTRAFSVLFAPDANSISSGPLIESGSTTDPNAMVLFRRDNSCRFLYLRDDAAVATTRTVRLLARSLGAKRCAYAIDACVAEVFETCSRSDNSHFSTGGGLNQRTHWSGACVFATELLRGLGEAKDLSKSYLRILSSLASSVLPAIVADPLWTLPTVFESNASRGAEQSSSFSNGGAPSVAVMHSNAILISSLMSLISQFAHSLGSDIGLHLPTILLPILERSSPVGNHTSVQRAAFSLLWEISLGTGCKDVSSLLASNVDYLMDAISLRLRKHAREQSRMGRSLLGVVDVILRSLVYSRDVSSNEGSGGSSVVAHVITVVHMLDRLLDHFDRQTYVTAFTLFDTVGVFRSMCSFMDESIDANIESNVKSSTPPSPSQEEDKWFNRLDFELNVESGGDEEGPDDAFDEPIANQEAGPPKVGDDETNSVLSNEIKATNSILKRCCYLLGYGDLRIQTICCDTILCGFQALGKVGSFRRTALGVSASNPLLPSIAEFWPSIVAQLRTASASLESVNRISRSDLTLRHAMAADQERGPSKAGLEHLIAQLLRIVSELCASSDGFFVDRFENDAFPVLAGLVQDCHSSDVQSRSHSAAQQKHTLLLSILECFQRTFESSCGSGLAHLVPAAGTMLFPLLAYGDPVGEAALAAVKAMLTVDSDSLWHGLHKLSPFPFPCNPLGSNKGVSPCSKSIVAVAGDRRDRTLSQRAGELLDFAERLPEQSV
ncbi:hypothetical protein ACHAXT_006459 [Thalassiosira profunda]